MLSTKLKALLLLIGVLFTFTPPMDPDFGWHYKLGEYITQNKSIPTENLYSYSMPDYKWVDSYWIPQVILYKLYSNFGYILAGLILSFIYCGAVLLITDKFPIKRNAKIFAYLILTSLISITFVVSVRPMLYSTIFLLLEIYILLQKKNHYLLPFVFLIWANSHADFVPGLIILFGYTGYRIIFSKIKLKLEFIKNLDFFELTDYTQDTTKISKILFISVLSLLATLINPSGIHLWTTLLKEANPVQFKIINEWLPYFLDINDTQNFYNILIVIAFSAFLIAFVLITSKKFPLWLTVLSIALFFISIRAKYFLRFFVITSIFQSSIFLQALIEKSIPIIKDKYIKAFKIVMSVSGTLTFLSALVFFIQNISISLDIAYWSKQHKYPYQAVQKIKQLRPEGNMFNTYDWGGYLIKTLPEYKTYADGRMASWNENGKYILEDFYKVYKEPEKNTAILNEILSKNNIGFVIDKKDSVLIKHLTKTDQWKEVYSDETSILLFNKTINP
jgi:hypothetical protein